MYSFNSRKFHKTCTCGMHDIKHEKLLTSTDVPID